MLDVTERIRNDWINGEQRTLKIEYFENDEWFEITGVEMESTKLTESLADGNSDFVGCISSMFTFSAQNLALRSFEGKKIRYRVGIEGNADMISMFVGYVKDCKLQSNKKTVEVTCYDALYSLSNMDMAGWLYGYADTHMTYREFRDTLFNYLGIFQKGGSLPNDDITIDKLIDNIVDNFAENKTIYAIDLIKSICQINGAYGLINRQGHFEYRYVTLNDFKAVFLPYTLPYMPQENSEEHVIRPIFYQYYKSCNYEEYSMNKITRVVIRQSEDSKAGYYGTSKAHRYIIQGNHYTLKTSKEKKSTIAHRIFDKIKDLQIFPFDAEVDGIPWLEVGDTIQLYAYDYAKSEEQAKDVYSLKSFIVMNRTIEGLHGMSDNVSASVSKNEKNYILDMGWREAESVEALTNKIDEVEGNVNDLSGTVSGYGDDIRTLQENYWDVQSVATLPENPDPRTIYLIQGSIG